MPTIFHIQVSTFAGFDPDACHYFGELCWRDERGKSVRFELEHPISTKEAIVLNKSDRGPAWKKGDNSNRFDSEKSILKFAMTEFEKRSKSGDILCRGTPALAGPHEVLAGPSRFVREGNKLRKKAEKIDFYEKEPEVMEKIYQQYVKLLKEFRLE